MRVLLAGPCHGGGGVSSGWDEPTPLVVGHTPCGEQVAINSFQMYSPFRFVIQLEIGQHSFELDHLDPELIPALTRSLRPTRIYPSTERPAA